MVSGNLQDVRRICEAMDLIENHKLSILGPPEELDVVHLPADARKLAVEVGGSGKRPAKRGLAHAPHAGEPEHGDHRALEAGAAGVSLLPAGDPNRTVFQLDVEFFRFHARNIDLQLELPIGLSKVHLGAESDCSGQPAFLRSHQTSHHVLHFALKRIQRP